MVCYAGTRADRAQETLDVTLGRAAPAAATASTDDEIDRVQAGLKTSLIMQQESTGGAGRARWPSDWYYLGRVRTLDEIAGGRSTALTPTAVILAYLDRYPVRQDLTLVTLGPEPLHDARIIGDSLSAVRACLDRTVELAA